LHLWLSCLPLSLLVLSEVRVPCDVGYLVLCGRLEVRGLCALCPILEYLAHLGSADFPSGCSVLRTFTECARCSWCFASLLALSFCFYPSFGCVELLLSALFFLPLYFCVVLASAALCSLHPCFCVLLLIAAFCFLSPFYCIVFVLAYCFLLPAFISCLLLLAAWHVFLLESFWPCRSAVCACVPLAVLL